MVFLPQLLDGSMVPNGPVVDHVASIAQPQSHLLVLLGQEHGQTSIPKGRNLLLEHLLLSPAQEPRPTVVDMAERGKEGVHPIQVPGGLPAADMGVTGANFIVAASGAVVLLENEGNIRLSTTIPRIHVAVTGIEKVVPTWEDLSVLLQLLPRNATGQKLSSYVSLFLGPRRLGEPDGPDEFHLVLVDNGRSRILADEAFREGLRCIRCGACLNICPVYLKTGWTRLRLGLLGAHRFRSHASAAPGPTVYVHTALCQHAVRGVRRSHRRAKHEGRKEVHRG